MHRLAIIAALILSGCSTVGSINQQLIDQSEPTVVWDDKGRAYLWLRGVVKMPRMQELDRKAEPAATPKS